MKRFLLALAGLILITACGSQAKQTDVQKGSTLSATQELSCKGAAFQGNEWYVKGAVWSEVDFVNFTQPTKVERSGMNYCRNETGQAVTLTVKEIDGEKTRSFVTTEDHFYFEITSAGKIVGDGITEVKSITLGKFDVEVTTPSRNELYIKYGSVDGKEIIFTKGRVFNSTSSVILSSLTPGIIKLIVCFNEAGTETCNNVASGGKMDPQNSVNLKTVQTNFDPHKILNYVEENKEEALITELMADGSFSSVSPTTINLIVWEGTTICMDCPIDPDLNVVDGLYGTHARGFNIVHTGAVWTDISDWGQSLFSFWCRMQVAGSCGYTPSLINDSARSAGTWASTNLPGTFGDSADDRQFRRSVTITDGKRYNIKYCVRTASGAPMYMDLVSTNNAGDQLQVSIYDLVMSANTLYCDSFTFEATSTGSFYLSGHIGSVSAGDIRFDDFSLTEVP